MSIPDWQKLPLREILEKMDRDERKQWRMSWLVDMSTRTTPTVKGAIEKGIELGLIEKKVDKYNGAVYYVIKDKDLVKRICCYPKLFPNYTALEFVIAYDLFDKEKEETYVTEAR